jgi:hypothetical protein
MKLNKSLPYKIPAKYVQTPGTHVSPGKHESLPYRISTISVKLFMGYMEVNIYVLIQRILYYGLVWLKIGIA